MKVNTRDDFNGDDDDDKVRYYTGLPSFVILKALFNLVRKIICH